MKKIVFLAVAAFLSAAYVCASGQTAQQLKYYDVKECGFPVVNQGFDDCTDYYGRLSVDMKDKVRESVWSLARNTAGVAVRFRSDARAIGVKWTLISAFRMNHMAASGICGCDLYGYDEGEWKYVGTARPGNGKENMARFRNMIDGKMREYVIFLPLYDGVTSLAIGVDEGATVEMPGEIGANPFGGKASKPIVFFGHSITQGGCASRPGMAATNILCRKLGREVINLGFSGNGQLYSVMAEELVKIDAGAYVLDCLANNYLDMTRDSTEKFVRTIVNARPQTPLYFVSMYPNVTPWVGDNTETEQEGKDAVFREMCATLKSEGYKTYFIDLNGPGRNRRNPLEGSSAGADGEVTVDGGHLTDLGFLRLAEFLYPYFKKVK